MRNERRNRWKWMSTCCLTGAATMLIVSTTGCGPSNKTLRMRGEDAYLEADYARAHENYMTVVERAPEDIEANVGLGKVYLATNAPQRARTYFTVAYHAVTPGKDKAFEIARLLAEAMAADEDFKTLFTFLRDRAHLLGEVRDYIQWGDFALRFDDPDTAETAYLGAARVAQGQSVAPYLKLAELYESVGDTAEVTRRLRQAYGIDPDDREVIERLSQYETVIGPTLALPLDDDQ